MKRMAAVLLIVAIAGCAGIAAQEPDDCQREGGCVLVTRLFMQKVLEYIRHLEARTCT